MRDHHPIEIRPPDLAPLRHGNPGVDYVHAFDSGRAGPTVMLQALTHGNEFAGAIALIDLLRAGLRPQRGRLIVAFANVAAFARFDFDDPDASRYVEVDYDRVWTDEVPYGARDSVELRRARELAPFVDAADFLLDLHSMHEPCRPIMVCGQVRKNAEFARAVDVAWDTTLRFLRATGALDDSFVAPRLRLPAPPAQRLIRVTEAVVAKSMDFRFAGDYTKLETIARAGTPVAYDGDTVWRTPCDDTVLVMPSMHHLKPGTTMVRLGRYETPA